MTSSSSHVIALDQSEASICDIRAHFTTLNEHINPQFKLSFSQFFALKARCNERSFYIRKEPSWSNKCSVVTQKSKPENKKNEKGLGCYKN